MKALRSIIGFALAPILVFALWGLFGDAYGIIGGWLAALVIIAPMWFINHYVGLIPQDDDAAFVDMGLAVGIGGIANGVFSGAGLQGLIGASPTIILVIIGGALGGIVSAKVLDDIEKRNK